MKKQLLTNIILTATLATLLTGCGGTVTIGEYDGNGNPKLGRKVHVDYGRKCMLPEPQKVKLEGAPWTGYNLDCREPGLSLKIKFEGQVKGGPISLFMVKEGESVPESLYQKATKDDKWFNADGAGTMIKIYPPAMVEKSRGGSGVEIVLIMHGPNTIVDGTLSAEWVKQSE